VNRSFALREQGPDIGCSSASTLGLGREARTWGVEDLHLRSLGLGLELTMQSHLYTPMSSGMNISTTEPVSRDPSGGTSRNSSETVRHPRR